MSIETKKELLRVLVVDDHELFRIGLRQLLEEDGFEVADARSTEAVLRRLPTDAPDVVVIGVNLPAATVSEDVRRVLDAAPGTAALVLALVADDEQVLQTVRAGAAGYLLKESELGQILAGIRAVAAGQSALSPQAARVLIDHVRRGADLDAPAASCEPRGLSKRERQVLSLLASGRDNAEIGDILFVSQSTVKHHVSRLFEKLEVDNRVRAAAYAIRNGLVDENVRSG